MKIRCKQFWIEYGALLLSCVYAGGSFALMCAKHNAFNTRIYDFARFSQAIWSTLHNRFMFSSLHYGSILGNHFSPLMALTAPLLLLWDNARLLFLVQAVNAAAAVYIIQCIIKDKSPKLAPWFTLLAFLNPALHDVTLFEVRRITFGMPFFALALYALYKKQRILMLAGLSLALLAKESMGLYVFMIGFYLAVFEKDWRWGLGLMTLGAGWSIVISLWVIPLIRSIGGDLAVYPQLYYYNHLGSTYGEILQRVIQKPFTITQVMFQSPQLKALFRVLLPFGFVLPFLQAKWVTFCLPYVGLMFLSSDIDMMQLDKWYMTTIFPVLLASTAAGWKKIPEHRERTVFGLFVFATILSFILYSVAPFGGRYDPELYTVTARNRLEMEMVNRVPVDACVVAQNHYVPHLTHRFDLYHYPIYKEDACLVTYYLLDKTNNAHPADLREIRSLIDQWLPDPAIQIVAEAEDILLFRQGGDPMPSVAMNAIAEDSIHLTTVELAIEDEYGVYTNSTANPLSLRPGQGLRVYLYWEALDSPGAERSVSVRVMSSLGELLAQHDSMPGGGSKPTSFWEEGWVFRDIYYLYLPDDAPMGNGSLEIVLYDTYTIETVPFDGERDSLPVRSISIIE